MPRINNKIIVFLITLCCSITIISVLSGCIKRQEIRQGRIIEAKEISDLELGMSRAQVEYILGSPSSINPLDQDRWEYVYILRNKKGVVKIQKGYLLFEDGKLAIIDLDEYIE